MKNLFNCYSRFLSYCSFATIIMTLQACVVSGGGTGQNSQIAKPQSNLAQFSNDPLLQADQIFVQNFVTTEKMTLDANGQLPWDNSTTGSQGVISNYVEINVNGQNCRNFQTERTAYNGVSLYNGQVCKDTAGKWQMTRFQILQ